MKTTSMLASVGLLTTLSSACQELPFQPTGLSDQLVLYAVLNPDSTRHVVDVAPMDGMTTLTLTDIKVAIHRRGPSSGEWTLVAEWDSARAAAAGTSFTGRSCYSGIGDWPGPLPTAIARTGAEQGLYCLRPEAVLEPGAMYRVEVRAEGRVPVVGETRAVGDFEIERAIISGRADSHSLAASWSQSKAAHRYLMGVRRRYEECYNCEKAWYADVEGSSFQGPVPQWAIDIAGDTPMLDVLAVDRHFHAFLTTGDEGNLHTVHPVQNVTGGYGVVGSYRHRSRKIDK